VGGVPRKKNADKDEKIKQRDKRQGNRFVEGEGRVKEQRESAKKRQLEQLFRV
jgi:hypothetical protein